MFNRIESKGCKRLGSLVLCLFLSALLLAVPIGSRTGKSLPGFESLFASSALAEQGPVQPEPDNLRGLNYVANSGISAKDGDPLAEPSLPVRRTSPLVIEPIAPPSEPLEGAPSEAVKTPEPGAQTLGRAMEDMIRRNPVVAEVEGEEIRWKDVIESAGDLPEEYQSRIESIFPALLDRLIDLKLLANAAREKRLDENEDLQRRVKSYEDILLRDAYVAETVAPEISDADVRARYFEVLRANAGTTERRLRHVVVESRDEALAVVQSLDDGLDFAELARSYSIGGSAANGGELGFMRRDSLEPGFAAAAFDLRVGAYSSEPLRTEFGWHVIKVEEERKADLPAYEELASKLREELARERIAALLRKLRADADLDLFPEN